MPIEAGAFLEATAQQLRLYQPPVLMGFSGVIRRTYALQTYQVEPAGAIDPWPQY